MKSAALPFLTLLLALVLNGCAGMSQGEQRMVSGAAIGAVVGGPVGGGVGALLGAGVGAGVGYAVDQSHESY
jgi:osmotically inducible lipoprotein OsmB